MSERILPLGDMLKIRILKEESKYGSIVLPDSTKKNQLRGEIIALADGPWIDGRPRGYKANKGDIIVIYDNAGIDVEDVDGECRLINNRDILAKVENL